MDPRECHVIEKGLNKVWGRVRKKMHVWAGNPGVPTFGYISSLSRKVIYFFLK